MLNNKSASANSFWFLFYNILRIIVTFVGTIFVSRELGPKLFGEFSFILTIFLYTLSFDSLCNQNVVKKLLLDKEINTNEVMGSSSLLNLLIAFLCLIVFIPLGSELIEGRSLFIAFIILLVSCFIKPFNNITYFFDSVLKSKVSSACLFFATLISILVRVYYAQESRSIFDQSVGYTLQAVFLGCFLFVFYRKDGSSLLNWRVKRELVKKIAVSGFPIFIGAALTATLMRLDTIMLMKMMSAEDVGVYSIVIKISEPWVIISTAICTSFFPILIRKKNESYEIFGRTLEDMNRLMISIVLVIGLCGTMLVDLLIPKLFGAAYISAASYFKVYIWSVPFLFMSNLQHLWEVIEERNYFLFIRSLLACSTNLLLNYLWIPRYGAIGAAYATVIAYFMLGMGSNLFFKKTREYLCFQLKGFNLLGIKRALILLGRG